MTSGSQQGLDYSSRVFVNPGDVIIIESPSYLGALNAFKACQPKFVEIPTDDDGMALSILAAGLVAVFVQGMDAPAFLKCLLLGYQTELPGLGGILKGGGLVSMGCRQIDALAERFKSIPIDALYSSDLRRAITTAGAITKYHKLPLHTTKRLREINCGPWEGMPFGNVERLYPVEMGYFNNDPDQWHVAGAETFAQCRARILSVLTDIAREHGRGQVQGHQGVAAHPGGHPVSGGASGRWAGRHLWDVLLPPQDQAPEIRAGLSADYPGAVGADRLAAEAISKKLRPQRAEL